MLSLYRRAPWHVQLLTIVVIVAALAGVGYLGLQQFQAGDTSAGEAAPSVDVGGAAAVLPQGERAFGLHVVGEGEVVVSPDRAIVTLGVESAAATAADAAAQTNETAGDLIDAIRGVSSNEDEVRIQTTGLSMAPVFPAVQGGGASTADPVGYRSANTVTVTIDKLELTSQVLDAALGAGANTVRSIEFTLQDDGPAKARALRMAVLDAAAKARAVADALRGSVRGLIALHEDFVSFPQPSYRGGAAFAAEAVQAPAPVAPGELRVRAVVRANFAYE